MIGESDPVFVKIDKYKDIMDLIEVIDKKVGTVKQILNDLENLKQKEDEEIANWEKNVEEIAHKVVSIKEEMSGD